LRILTPDGVDSILLWHALLHLLLWDPCGWTYILINHSKRKNPWPLCSVSQIEWDFSSLECPTYCCQGSSSSFAMGGEKLQARPALWVHIQEISK